MSIVFSCNKTSWVQYLSLLAKKIGCVYGMHVHLYFRIIDAWVEHDSVYLTKIKTKLKTTMAKIPNFSTVSSPEQSVSKSCGLCIFFAFCMCVCAHVHTSVRKASSSPRTLVHVHTVFPISKKYIFTPSLIELPEPGGWDSLISFDKSEPIPEMRLRLSPSR